MLENSIACDSVRDARAWEGAPTKGGTRRSAFPGASVVRLLIRYEARNVGAAGAELNFILSFRRDIYTWISAGYQVRDDKTSHGAHGHAKVLMPERVQHIVAGCRESEYG